MESVNNYLEGNNAFVTDMNKYLQNRNIEGINSFINNDKFKEMVKQKSNELIPLVCKELNERNFKENSEFFNCCEDFNLRIAEIGFPEECLLDYLEEAECEDDIKFASVLKAIKKILLRIPEKRNQTFEWVLNTIHRHILSLPSPKDYKLEPNSHKLLDCDPIVQRISEIYRVIIKFYNQFIYEIHSKVNFKNVSLQSLFLLLGEPLAFMDLEHSEKCTSSMRRSAEKIMYYIVQLSSDVAWYIKFISMCNFNKLEPKEEPLVDCDVKIEEFFSDPTKIPILSLAIFYYLVFVEKLFLQYFSSVYNPTFVLQTVGELTVYLLKLPESLCQRKGLLLLNVLLERLPEASVEYTFLDCDFHKNVVENLATICVYSEVKSNRKLAVEVLTRYLFKFETRGLYLIFLNYKNVIENPGLCGYITTLLKDTIIKTFKQNMKQDIEYFCRKRLRDLLIKCCNLPQGTKTDLIHNSDQIISSLNLILYLIMWDKENKTGIWSFVQELDGIFFSPLREGIVLSTAHYELEIKNIEQGVAKSDFDSLMSVTVGHEQLGKLSKEEKISIMNKSLTTLTLIGAILGRVTECIEATTNAS